MNHAFRFSALLSLTLHLVVIGLVTLFVSTKPIAEVKYEIEITLLTQLPKTVFTANKSPELNTPKLSAPQDSWHNEDDLTKSNQNQALSNSANEKPSEPRELEPNNLKQPTQAEPKQLKALQSIFGENVEIKTNQEQFKVTLLKEYDESVLDKNQVNIPLGEKETARARKHNKITKRMYHQVVEVFRRIAPKFSAPEHRVTIKMELDKQGHLLKAVVVDSSGNPELDKTLLLAIQGVERFEIPPSDDINYDYRFPTLVYPKI